MNSRPVLKIDDLSIGYRKPISTGINLDLRAREFVTIMGENGVGKTTLIETLFGTLRPFSGGLEFFDGLTMTRHRDRINARTGWVISRMESYPPFLDVDRFFKAISGLYPKWRWDLVEDLSRSFDLDLKKRLANLSLGENSKVRLIKALAMEPELLILDELTANLSETSKTAVTQKLIEIFSDRAMSVLYVSHSREDATRLSDRVMIMTPHGLRDA